MVNLEEVNIHGHGHHVREHYNDNLYYDAKDSPVYHVVHEHVIW